MPLNYSKWDTLEVSDDSDIEGHPNVDHKSLVRWKQRDVHEKRAVRNQKIAGLKAEIACNHVLLRRLKQIVEDLRGTSASDDAAGAGAYFNQLVERLRTDPSPDAPASEADAPGRLTYDEMVLSLLLKVGDDVKQKKEDVVEGGGGREGLREALVREVDGHVMKLGERTEELRRELGQEEAEKAKKITSEGMHEGFTTKYVPPTPDPAPLTGQKKKGMMTEKKTDIEVLNSKAVENAQVADLVRNAPMPTSTSSKKKEADEGEEEEEELPEMTPNLEAFSRIPVGAYETSFHFIQQHRDVYTAGASDALLVAAFTAQRSGDTEHARRCVNQSLLLQYCEKLGRDGVSLFFRRMMSGEPRVEAVFRKDVEDTYKHIVERVKVTRAEEEEALRAGGGDGEEQIQLVAENPDQTISFIIPDGPPPENLVLEGPGTEDLEIEDVRKALQLRWDVFNGFSEEMKNALRAQSLEAVNRVLGAMKVADAEAVVGLLDSAGILNFAEGGIRDETGRAQGEEESEDQEADVEDEIDEDEDEN